LIETSSADEVLQPVGPADRTRIAQATSKPAIDPAPENANPNASVPAQPQVAALTDTKPELPAGSSAATSAARELDAGDDPGRTSTNPRIDSVLRRYEAGERLDARRELNAMLRSSRDPGEQEELRRRLTDVAEETVFSREITPGDPLFESYTVQSGDVLIRIGRTYDVPAEAIMLINGIKDAGSLRPGQRLKAPRGPFNVVIAMSHYRMDVYLQDTYVRSFPVGLGAQERTPAGVWVVKERLPNPTYYPPASAPDKRIIPPNDPLNPLGEHWIGLEGVEGAAIGQEGFGIHGTIEPDSIGRSASMGCVRMHNDDVAWIYQLMTPKHSRVTTAP
jgi:LysM repeat protein